VSRRETSPFAVLIHQGDSFNEEYVPTPWQTCLVYWAALLGSLLINLFFNRYAVVRFGADSRHLDKLNIICLYWTAASVVM
jgi:hypothetical protein